MTKILRVVRSMTDGSPRPALDAVSPASSGSAPVELVERIMDEFHRFIGELRCAGTERLVRAGVSMTHLYVMGLLAQHGDTPMSRVAELLDVSLSNATGIVDRMAERGFVERVRVADDRRVVLVRLTDRGRTVLDEAEVLRRDLIERLLSRLDAGQLERLSATLADVHGAVSGLIGEDPTLCGTIGTYHGPHLYAYRSNTPSTLAGRGS